MRADRRLKIAAAVAAVLLIAGACSEFFTGTFWDRHALLASLASNVLVVIATVLILNQLLERRDRRRWSLLAQSVILELVQGARVIWTGLSEVLRLTDVRSGSLEALLDTASVARDGARVSSAVTDLLADPERRASLQRVCTRVSEHESALIARWAPVMVGAGPYTEVLDRHVELAARMHWLSDVLAHNEPLDGRTIEERTLTRASPAAERAEELGGDDVLHDQLLAVIRLATDLDRQSREHALSLLPADWWTERTASLAGDAAMRTQPSTGSDGVPGR